MQIIITIPKWFMFLGLGIWYFVWLAVASLLLSISILGIADVWWHFNQCPHCGRLRKEDK